MKDKNWDNLTILDACRYDCFANQHDFDATLDRVVSPGKMSWEFMKKTRHGEQFHDTIYITSNPFATRLLEDTFFKTQYLIDECSDKIGTIHPDNVGKAAKDANQKHPNKRLIVHFMQPHRPYLGDTAEKIRERVYLAGYRNKGDVFQIWVAVKEGLMTVEGVRNAYAESLDADLEEVEKFLCEVDSKLAVTSEHGEMLGRRVFHFTSRVWGHSGGFSTPRLREIPLLEVGSESRREITASEPIDSGAELDNLEVQSRLEALGYAK